MLFALLLPSLEPILCNIPEKRILWLESDDFALFSGSLLWILSLWIFHMSFSPPSSRSLSASDHAAAIASYLASPCSIAILQSAAFAAEVGVPFDAPPPLAKASTVLMFGGRRLRSNANDEAMRLDHQFRTEPHEKHLHFVAILSAVVRKAVLRAIGGCGVNLSLSAASRAACAEAAALVIVPWTRPQGAPPLPLVVAVQLPAH